MNTELAPFIGAIAGIMGTLLLAMRGPRAGWGFVAYLVSNVAWMAVASAGQPWLLVQHAVFLISSLVGIWVWLLRDHIQRRIDSLFYMNGWSDTEAAVNAAVYREFTGRNAGELARRYGMTTAQVYDIVGAHGGKPV